ncbi:L-aspartate oxidase [Marisediminicola antarctica]|uniref:L-aspartate oxidase n=1 Tax=Marisediminicola antarctica TaxID=674079 RepID=A0A7L5AGZ7_9MICO|nr:L-aspartate oxidase [Marisediminicola antarctica]QHO69830.1 L-aspartate oxidase [Marisediminicola antarctica]
MNDVVVVGSGIAGLIIALQASRTHRVSLVTKTELAESNTRYAQGGIAAVMFDDDSVAAHIQDTLAAGAGLGDPAIVEILCAEGPGRIRDLIALGVEFDRDGADLARGLEAAHSSARVLHAGGDATGAVIETALVAAVRRSAIQVHEHTFLAELVVDSGRVRGVEVVDPTGRMRVIAADAVVLASGGSGQLYRHTTNPAIATGDGAAAALRAGAVLSDVEFYQFHPTALAAPGNFLVSEAVRGEGAVLLDARGHRFMLDQHEGAELAPRDIVARGIATQMARQGGDPVLLDATSLGSAFLAERFPSIDAACRRLGLDWSERPIPVTPAAHYWMGGVATDEWGRTSLPGLFAVGEVSSTGVHGANRLASNSLLESLVFAWRAAARLDDAAWPALAPVEASEHPLPPHDGPGTAVSRDTLRDLAWSRLGLYRDAEGLGSAAGILASWRAPGDSVAERETRNLLDLARLMASAALAREESRGAHFRTDHPETSARFERHLGWVAPPAAAASRIHSPVGAEESVIAC